MRDVSCRVVDGLRPWRRGIEGDDRRWRGDDLLCNICVTCHLPAGDRLGLRHYRVRAARDHDRATARCPRKVAWCRFARRVGRRTTRLAVWQVRRHAGHRCHLRHPGHACHVCVGHGGAGDLLARDARESAPDQHELDEEQRQDKGSRAADTIHDFDNSAEFTRRLVWTPLTACPEKHYAGAGATRRPREHAPGHDRWQCLTRNRARPRNQPSTAGRVLGVRQFDGIHDPLLRYIA